jgi:hypothetical protein
MCQIRSGLWIEKVSICTNTSLSAADPRSEPGLATMYKTGRFSIWMGEASREASTERM